MRDFLQELDDLPASHGQRDRHDPVMKARELSKRASIKKFYQEATSVERDGQWQVYLDGRPLKTPAKTKLAHYSKQIADCITQEWSSQEEVVDPISMPMTRLVNSALDGVLGKEETVRASLYKIFETDLITYRAGEPEGLVRLQSEKWDPVFNWAEATFLINLIKTEGVIFHSQPEKAILRLRQELEAMDAFALVAFHTLATLTQSGLMALGLFHQAFDLHQVWDAAHVDEDWTNAQWGEDHEAMARRDYNFKEFEAAYILMQESRHIDTYGAT